MRRSRSRYETPTARLCNLATYPPALMVAEWSLGMTRPEACGWRGASETGRMLVYTLLISRDDGSWKIHCSDRIAGVIGDEMFALRARGIAVDDMLVINHNGTRQKIPICRARRPLSEAEKIYRFVRHEDFPD